MTDTFKTGDIVRLKSGGPKMTVERWDELRSGIVVVDCRWFVGEDERSSAFRAGCLELETVSEDIERLRAFVKAGRRAAPLDSRDAIGEYLDPSNWTAALAGQWKNPQPYTFAQNVSSAKEQPACHQGKLEDGFWGDTIPSDRIDYNWAHRAEFLADLIKVEEGRSANVVRYKGTSDCRACASPNGSAEFTLNGWKWPAGYRHYIAEHGVVPTLEFWNFIRRAASDPSPA